MKIPPGTLTFALLLCAGVTANLSAAPESVSSPEPLKADAPRVETIVFVRHGEKPANDEGQLTAQGLNRSLALADVLIKHYGPAQYIFAPATTKKPVTKGAAPPPGGGYSYVRPLATIEPTAIRLGLPVETKFAFDEIGGLQGELTTPTYQRATIFVAWEHHYLDELVKRMVSVLGGDAQTVPEWPADDFDSIFVVRISTDDGKKTISFTHDHENLNGLSTNFPQVTGK